MDDGTSPDFQALFQASPGLYLALAPDLRIVGASDAYLRATLTTRAGILGRHIFDVFPDNPNDPSSSGVRNLRASLERVIRSRQADAMPVQKYDVQRAESDGGAFEERYWKPLNVPVCGSDGKLIYIIHRLEDVTEFTQLKQQDTERGKIAQAVEDRASQMEAEVLQGSLRIEEANRQIKHANEALARLYHQIALLMEHADDELCAGETVSDAPLESIAPEDMLDRIGRLIVGHKDLEMQLRQSQKMEAIGRLAGGVAHDFNNLLTVITGYASMLRDDPANGKAMPELNEIEKAAVRAAALTQKLLAFSRKQILQPRIMSLNTVAAGMEELLRRLIGENVQLDLILANGVANIKADPHQLEQVIMNLVLNSRDAMPRGGRITIETRNVEVAAGFRSLAAGAYVLLSVTDNGHGMDPEVAERVFEPFFTTKDVGKGTGLGLSTVLGIVEQSGGIITVDSQPGVGSTFQVYLPAVTSAEGVEAAEQYAAAPARTGTVLLVEDETALRRLIWKTLAMAGYQVLEAANAEEAIALTSNPRRIDLLLTDVIMPGMSGPDLVAQVRQTRPDCRVLYISGYDHELVNQNALEPGAGFLPKPFTPRMLLARVREFIR